MIFEFPLMKTLVDKNSRKTYGCTPIHLAALSGHLEIYKLISKIIANKNSIDNFGQTFISVAHTGGNFDIVSFLENM